MSRFDRGRPSPQPDGLFYDPFPFAGGPGEWGRPDMDQGPRELSEGALERARAALTFGPRDHRFANLVARFNKFMR
jgi:hypothetical protein